VPQSGEIVGILKTMKDEMSADLATAEQNEAAALANFEELSAAKKAEIDACSQAIEEKLTRLADTGVELAQKKNDLEDTSEGLSEDQKFLADLGASCKTKQGEWDAYKKVQADELAALADTIRFLNDDDALELFKKALPGASSLLEFKVSAVAVRKQALAALKGVGRDARLDLLEMALRGQKGFDKVIKLIDDLVATLHREQADDDKKKDYCLAELDAAEDKVKAAKRSIADLEKAIEDEQASIATTKAEIEALEDSIKALDKSVAEATDLRKEEHNAYVEDLTTATTAKDLLGFAKNRLNKFYNPKLYKPPPKRELSEEDQISLNMGGTMAPTNPPGGIAGTGVGLAEVSAAPPPPPAANLAYKKKDGGGPIAMIDILVKDLDKQIQEMEVSEKDAQGDYEKFIADSADGRASSSKSLTDKESAKAAMEDELINNQEDLRNANYGLMETDKYISDLHGECDWNLKFHDTRQAARTKEIEALGNAKDVLKGSDYSL
jgi:septal ring factor EnvC (AmiA/AmiB activator)